MPENCLNRLYVARCSQDLRRERAPAAVGRSLFDTGLTVEPSERLLQSITAAVGLRPAAQLAMLECQLKGFSYLIRLTDQV